MGIRSPEQSRGKIIITLKQEESFGTLSPSEKDLFGARMPGPYTPGTACPSEEWE
jgi:hypothetical protein